MLKIGHDYAKAIASCMGYSLRKVLNLGQNFKLPKTCQNRFCNSVQKTARKNTKYFRNETMLKIGHLAKSIGFAWAIAFAKYSIWAKILNCLKHVKIGSVFTLE